MGELLNLELEQKALAVREQLAGAVREHARVVYSNSLGAEAMVLTDIIWSHVPEIDIFSIDTGRLHEETYELLEKLERRYKKRNEEDIHETKFNVIRKGGKYDVEVRRVTLRR